MPRAPKDRQPKACEEFTKCGNFLPDPRATWCPDCGTKRRTAQRKKKNRRAYLTLRDPGTVLLPPRLADITAASLGALAAAFNRYAEVEDDPGTEPAAREVLLAALEVVLVDLWEELPSRLTHRKDDDDDQPR